VRFLPEGVPPEEWAKFLEAMPLMEVPASPLIRVIGVGQSVDTNGITVELLAIEIREAGAVIHWRARAASDLPMLMAEVSVSDDLGTAYSVMPAESGSGDRHWQGQTYFAPGPPPGARLSITLDGFGPFLPMPGYTPKEPVRGPWRFELTAETT
jgi:hypothetical protein